MVECWTTPMPQPSTVLTGDGEEEALVGGEGEEADQTSRALVDVHDLLIDGYFYFCPFHALGRIFWWRWGSSKVPLILNGGRLRRGPR